MKYFILYALAFFPFVGSSYSIAGSPALHFHPPIYEITEHGGGCRKSSPSGQCCHMQTSTGQVHCH